MRPLRAESVAAPVPMERPPVLLTMAGYGGTLAAVRCLGRAGISVTVAADGRMQPAAWSRFTTRRVRCPDFRDSERFLSWLLAFGAREPKHVLYPTCDELAFLFARHAAELEPVFHLYLPPFQTVLTLLDKSLLTEAARKAGLQTPATWVAGDEAALERIAEEARFPVLIKPRTQVMFPSLDKGQLVPRREDLLPAYRAYHRSHPYRDALQKELPQIARPLVQEYHPESGEDVESVAGFVDRGGQLFVARAATKVLQQPRRVGIGVCFEDAPLDPVVMRGLAALCRDTGYFGVFEVELIRVGSRRLLIDFNPRYYNQMVFDIARGLPLPLLAYTGAVRDQEGLERGVRAAQADGGHQGTAYCDRLALQLVIAAETIAGRDEARRWRQWRDAHRGRLIEATFDGDDRLPGILAAARQMQRALRHPRAFVRGILGDH